MAAFAGLSGDYNPLHVDHEPARAGPFGRPVAHGLLGLAIASGLGSQAPRVATLAFLGILEWEFRDPIAFGDTVRVLTRVDGAGAQGPGPARGRHLAPAAGQPARRGRAGGPDPDPRPRARSRGPRGPSPAPDRRSGRICLR